MFPKRNYEILYPCTYCEQGTRWTHYFRRSRVSWRNLNDSGHIQCTSQPWRLGTSMGTSFAKQYFFCVFAYRDDISKMSYLTCVFKEVMRHYTTAPIVARMLDQRCIIDGVEFPKGSFFDLNIYSVHHNPEVWDDPWVCGKITICLMYLCDYNLPNVFML